MNKNIYDSKLFTMLLLGKWKRIVLGAILGALIIGIPYTLSKTVIGNFNYRGEAVVHVEYGEDSSGKMYDYINFFTWGQWITSDKYLDNVISSYNLSVDKETLQASLGAEVLADQRMVNFTVTTKDKELTAQILDAVSDSVTDMILEIPEVKSAELIDVIEAEKYFVYKSIPQSFVFGFIVGLFVAVLIVWIGIILDDSVYIPKLFEAETGIPLTEEESDNEIVIGKDIPDLGNLKDGVILVIEAGAKNGKAVDYVISECKAANISIKGARITNTDDKLIKSYYKSTTLGNLFMKG